jgi:hypothetical protein
LKCTMEHELLCDDGEKHTIEEVLCRGFLVVCEDE